VTWTSSNDKSKDGATSPAEELRMTMKVLFLLRPRRQKMKQRILKMEHALLRLRISRKRLSYGKTMHHFGPIEGL
jgi:hypothetical protein